MLQGSFPYHVDEKGRLKMPAEFLPVLGSSCTLTRGQDGCLWALPQAGWQALAEQLNRRSVFEPEARALLRFFVGSAVNVSLDSQGRLSIPPVLRDFAGIRHEVMLVGLGPHVEIWDRQRWEEYDRRFPQETIAELARASGM